MARSIIGIALILFGLVMFSGVLGRLVTVDIDTSAPLILETDYYGHSPEDGAVYTPTGLMSIFCWVYEAQSTVTSVVCKIDFVNYHLSLSTTDGNKLKYGYVGSLTQFKDEGSHSYTFTATNDHGLSGTRSGSYSVQADLDGSWYLNDIQIVSTDQQIKLATNTLEFMFVETQGTVNVCYVDYSGTSSGKVTLTEGTPTRWVATKAFSDGVYSMEFVATDASGHDIRFSIFALQIGDEGSNGDDLNGDDITTGWSFIQWLGLGTSGIGVLLMLPIGKGKK